MYCFETIYITRFHIIGNLNLGCSKFQEYKNKLKGRAEKVMKIFIAIVSLCGFIYQVQINIIYNQYMSGKTIVSIEFGELPDKSLPSITICFSSLLSMERAVKFYPGFGFVEISNLLATINKW